MIHRMTHIVQRDIAFSGKLFQVDILQVKGRTGKMHQREVVRHPGAVVVVPVLDADRLCFIRNYRVAVDQRLWELPAGKLEHDEDPQHAAIRELEEETGYQAHHWQKLGEFYTSPGFTDEIIHCYLAEDLVHVGQQLEPGEDIEIEPLEFARVFEMIDQGDIRDAKTITGLWLWQSKQGEAVR